MISLIFAVVVASIFMMVRIGTTDEVTLAHLARLNRTVGTELGPAIDWLAAGMNGDGAAFALIAADPSGSGPGLSLRGPAYRYSRLGYPYLSSLGVAGRDEFVLLGLTVIGFLAVAGTALMADTLHRQRGWKAWLLIFNPALLVGFLENTSEPLAILILSVSLLTGSRLAAAATGLTRASFVLGLAKDWRALAVGILTAIIVKSFWSWRFAEDLTSGSKNLDIPFQGILQSISIVGWLVVLAAVATALVGVVERDLGWVLSGLLVMSLSVVVVDNPLDAVRTAGLLPVLWAFGPRYQPRSIKSVVYQPVGGVSYPER